MKDTYIIGIDQSTQGTKALLFDQQGKLLKRADKSHEQIVNEKGWVSHDLEEIYQNTITVVRQLVTEAGIPKEAIAGVGISNQRETSAAWIKSTGTPLDHAIVWQCSRATAICERMEQQGKAETIRERTGMNLSPYFPASKFAWLLENTPGAKEKAEQGDICLGTIDTWLLYKLTGKNVYKTEYSNASRTQLFNILDLKWDEEICQWFGLKAEWMAEVVDSNASFGETDFDGFLEHPIPIHGVLGDSHGSLYGQGCHQRGMTKSTFGTGSSIMMNIGRQPVLSKHGVVTSLAWGLNGTVDYVLEGNINYTGAVITWLKDDLELIQSPAEAEPLARKASQDDSLYLIPAFTGLGAPYWDSHAAASLTGITRTTKRAEIVRAALECISYQIGDVVSAMEEDAGLRVEELRVDGGPTRNTYLMQFTSDLLDTKVQVPDAEELSGMGAAYAAGIALKIFDSEVFDSMKRTSYHAQMSAKKRQQKKDGWKKAVETVLTK